MYIQIPKQLIDVGEIGNASTGDILFDGGVKLNDDLNAIYNSFGDQRLNAGDRQVIHATGYYQKVTATDIAAEIPMGSMLDIDASGGLTVIVKLAKGKAGERIEFINSNGSLNSNTKLIIQPNDSFVSVAGNLEISAAYSKVVCWCVSDVGGVSRWDYSIESLFGDKLTPVDETYSLSSTARDIPLFFRDAYDTAKLLVTASSTDGTKVKASEILLNTDWKTKQVYHTEYAVLRRGHTDEDDEILSLDFKYVGDQLVATASSVTVNMRLAIKFISTQKIGVAL